VATPSVPINYEARNAILGILYISRFVKAKKVEGVGTENNIAALFPALLTITELLLRAAI
jgi:hypothetical protein